jgi:serine/threonine protein kinase/Tol biopolymer transport system component
MALTSGTRLGPYEIVASLGAGGMGEVYRAKDTRLSRDVAIKILPASISKDPIARQRFAREAKTISGLNHPNICALHDVGSQDGIDYLVMECVEGETLAKRLEKGPLPLEQVLKYGIEIASALEKAHRSGVVHRDLKPGNVMLTSTGAKLLDFGLAKPGTAFTTFSPSSSAATTTTLDSPAPISTAGMIVGTIQYMSPEQLEGKEADARSDIFALGTVLYEMTTGRRAFDGKSQLSIASAILQKEPTPVTAIQPTSPASLDYVIRTCLAKNSDDRFQTAHDLKLQLNWLSQSSGAAFQLPLSKLRPRRYVGVIAGSVLLALVVMTFLLLFKMSPDRAPGTPLGSIRFTIALPLSQELAADATQALALSPDGKHLAYVAAEKGVSHLFVRRLDQFAPVEIPDSESATFPFFSPNGDWVAFFSQGKLKRVPADGGDPVLICPLPTFFGGTWTPDDIIVVTLPSSGLATVPATGGPLRGVTIASDKATYPQGPAWFPGPGGDWIAFTDYLGNTRRVDALNLATGELRSLVNNAQSPYYSEGHLVYYSGGMLWAVAFDPKKLAVMGDPTQVATGVAESNYVAQASASSNGTLVYAPGPAGMFLRNLYLVNRTGSEKKLDVPMQDYVDPAMSPDGKRIAVAIRSGTEGQQIAVYERDRGVLTHILANGKNNVAPSWTPDGKDLLFDIYDLAGKRGIYRVASDGSSPPQLVRETTVSSHVTSAAGGYAAVMVNDPVTSTDLWLLNLRSPFEMHPFKQTPATERQGSLSPDGRWMAYASNLSGRSEIYVEPVPGPGGRWQISMEGGEQPRWARGSGEIFYRNGSKMMSALVQLQPVFRAAKPVELFDRRFDRGAGVASYDVSPDGKTFLMVRSQYQNPTEIRVIIGWPNSKPTP